MYFLITLPNFFLRDLTRFSSRFAATNLLEKMIYSENKEEEIHGSFLSEEQRLSIGI